MSYTDIKEECFEANLLLPKYNLVDLTFGNVSVADPARGVFAIKPSGVDYKLMKAGDMVVVDFDGKTVEGALNPSSDTPTHRGLFLAFKNVRSVVHTHSRNAVAFAQAGRPIPCLGTTHSDFFFGEVPVTRPLSQQDVSFAYEWETGQMIVERFTRLNPLEMPGVLVHGHGPFTWGTSGVKAVETAFALEIIAEMALKTIQINPQVQPIARYLLDKHFLRKHGATATYGQSQEPGK